MSYRTRSYTSYIFMLIECAALPTRPPWPVDLRPLASLLFSCEVEILSTTKLAPYCCRQLDEHPLFFAVSLNQSKLIPSGWIRLDVPAGKRGGNPKLFAKNRSHLRFSRWSLPLSCGDTAGLRAARPAAFALALSPYVPEGGWVGGGQQG